MPLTQVQEDVEHERKVEQLRAQVENLRADTRAKLRQHVIAPWLMMIGSMFGGVAAVATVLLSMLHLMGKI